MKIVIFVSGGLGNALLLIPLIKELRKKSIFLTGVFTSNFGCESLFENTKLFNQSIVINPTLFQLLKFGFAHLQEFDEAYLDYSASTRKNILVSKIIAKKIISNHVPENFPPFLRRRVTFFPLIKGIHEATQNKRLLEQNASDEDLNEIDFELPIDSNFSEFKNNLLPNQALKSPFVVIQISGGNNVIKYKNWDPKNWLSFLKMSSTAFPKLSFILLGEEREIPLATVIEEQNISGVYSLVGKTSIQDVIHIIKKSIMYIGIDSGLMHLAVSLKTPTFTLWGPSDFNLYGYEKINPLRHKIVYKQMYCAPCNSRIAPNKLRVERPEDCPDNACLRDLTPSEVFDKFRNFFFKID